MKRIEVRSAILELAWREDVLTFTMPIQPGEVPSPPKLLAGILGVQPFSLRWGVPMLSEMSPRHLVTGASGFDRWLMPGVVNTVRLDIPESQSAILEVADWHDGVPEHETTVRIDKNSRSASVHLSVEPSEQPHMVIVRRDAGQPYTLQGYAAGQEKTLEEEGDYLVAAMLPGFTGDEADRSTSC